MAVSPIAGNNSLPDTADQENHAGIANATSADSWVEGFADYMAAVIAQAGGDPRPHELFTTNGVFNLSAGGARLDDPETPGFNPTFGPQAEERAIASAMWRLQDILGRNALLGLLSQNQPDLQTWKDVYDALRSREQAGDRALNALNCTINNVPVRGVDCVFVARGFYHDANGTGLYDAGEEVGVTRWNGDPPRGPEVRREVPPPIPGSLVRLQVVDESGVPLDGIQFTVEIEYDPPFEREGVSYVHAPPGSGPHAFPIVVPGNPSRAIVVAFHDGVPVGDPLVIESEIFHERINPAREGGVPEFLLEHTFQPESAPADPAAMLRDVIAAIEALDLPPRLERPILWKLRLTLRLLTDGRERNDWLAGVLLVGCIWTIDALSPRFIATDDADALIGALQAIVDTVLPRN